MIRRTLLCRHESTFKTLFQAYRNEAMAVSLPFCPLLVVTVYLRLLSRLSAVCFPTSTDLVTFRHPSQHDKSLIWSIQSATQRQLADPVTDSPNNGSLQTLSRVCHCISSKLDTVEKLFNCVSTNLKKQCYIIAISILSRFPLAEIWLFAGLQFIFLSFFSRSSQPKTYKFNAAFSVSPWGYWSTWSSWLSTQWLSDWKSISLLPVPRPPINILFKYFTGTSASETFDEKTWLRGFWCSQNPKKSSDKSSSQTTWKAFPLWSSRGKALWLLLLILILVSFRRLYFLYERVLGPPPKKKKRTLNYEI